jgi:hypothetical protein
MAGCCGCKALYFNSYKRGLITEQFVVETSFGIFEPTKHIFTTKGGKVDSFNSFVAVIDSSYTLPVSGQDKVIFQKLDSVYQTWSYPKRAIVFTKITGFKKAERTHFPVGIKMPNALKYGR